MHLVRYREAQDDLMETPDSLPIDFVPDTATARQVVAAALADGREWLDPLQVNALLRAYDIPAAPVALARDADEAADAARPILAEGGTVAVKILSPDIVHKSDIAGVELDLTSEAAVRRAAADILERARRLKPSARITGVTVQAMVRRPKARELIAGVADDPTFGPVVVFGRGGTAVEVINDKALALPPLDLKLARDLIARTRVSRILKAYRDVPAVDERAVALVLVKIAQLAADLPELRELDINPILADGEGIIAVDARIAVAPLAPGSRKGRGHPRFAVRPYPKDWERHLALDDGRRVFVRPVRPEDEDLVKEFFRHVTPEDLRLRFFAAVRDFSHAFIARLVQIDYARAIAFVALDAESGAMMGAVRLQADAAHETGEYAILVRSDLKGIGLGWRLMQLMVEWARAEGLRVVEGQVLRENTVMLDMCRRLGFAIRTDPNDPDIMVVKLALDRKRDADVCTALRQLGGRSVVDDDDMQAARPVRAEEQGLLDIGGARRPGDHVDGARHAALPVGGPQLVPDRLVVAGDIACRENDDVVVGQEIEGRRILRARGHDQRAGLGDAAESVADRGEVVAVAAAVADLERGLAPRHGGEARIVADAQDGREVVAAQEIRDGGRHLGGGGDLRHRREGGLGLRAEERDQARRRRAGRAPGSLPSARVAGARRRCRGASARGR